VAHPHPFESITEGALDQTIAVNLKSVFLVMQTVVPQTRAAPWGRIINMSSAAAQLGSIVGPH
jgi:NAD(P)-dependent dehydrogenase (short-subunit alcohol dehydrogenase family)